MNLSKAERLYRWLKFSLFSAIISLVLTIALNETVRGTLVYVMGFAYVLCWTAAVVLLGFLGNALGRFGLKYLLVGAFFNVLGIAVAFFRLRHHLVQARLAGSDVPATAKV